MKNSEHTITRKLLSPSRTLLIILGVVLAGCTYEEGDDDEQFFEDDGGETQGNDAGGSDGDELKPLSFFEDAVVGRWVRYHRYDDTYDYLILHSDRTGCKWEQDGSSRKSAKNYQNWELDEENPIGQNVFLLQYQKTPTSTLYGIDEFHYNYDEIWIGGYDNLAMTRSSTSKDCEF